MSVESASTKRPIIARVTAGSSSASPRATTDTACSRSVGSVSFSTNPLAPARNAATTYSSAPKVVSTKTRTDEVSGLEVMCRVASIPSMPGIRMSMSTTSGTCSRAAAKRLGTVGGLRDDLHPRLGGEDHRKAGSDQRLVVGHHDPNHAASPPSIVDGRGKRGMHGEAAAGQRLGGEFPVVHRHSLAHAGKALAGRRRR